MSMQPQHVSDRPAPKAEPVREDEKVIFPRPSAGRKRGSSSWLIQEVALPILLGGTALGVIAIGAFFYAF